MAEQRICDEALTILPHYKSPTTNRLLQFSFPKETNVMQVKSGTFFVVCVVLVFLAGDATACPYRENDYTCEQGAVLRGWVSREDRCVLRRNVFYSPFSCRGCRVYSGRRYMSVTTPGGRTYTCRYGSGDPHSACEAYCTARGGTVSHGQYICYLKLQAPNNCNCWSPCRRNN